MSFRAPLGGHRIGCLCETYAMIDFARENERPNLNSWASGKVGGMGRVLRGLPDYGRSFPRPLAVGALARPDAAFAVTGGANTLGQRAIV
jgi:hypothetical protein